MLNQFNDLIDRLRETPQRLDYHPEGNVFNHTARVLANLEARGVTDPVLLYTAVFHDLGKVETTRHHPKYGHLTAVGHDAVGARLWDFFSQGIVQLDDDQKRQVRWMIAQHMRIQKLDRMRPQKQDDFIASARKAGEGSYEKLMAFKACDDMNATLPYGKDQEGGSVTPAWDSGSLFARQQEAMNHRLDLLLNVIREQIAMRDWQEGHVWDREIAHRGDLILVRGVSGSGKSTVAEMFETGGGEAMLLSADDFFTAYPSGEYRFDASKLGEAHKACRVNADLAMGSGWSRVVVHNTFTQEWEMLPYFDLADRHGYRVHTLVVENRHGGESVHGVPKKTLRSQRERFAVKV